MWVWASALGGGGGVRESRADGQGRKEARKKVVLYEFSSV